MVFFPRFRGGSVLEAEKSLEGLVRNAYIGVAGSHPFSHFISTDEKELKFVEIEQEILKKVREDAAKSGYGIEVTFLGITYRDAQDASLYFIDEYGITYPNGVDEMGRISDTYGVTAVPETYVIDGQGRLAWSQIGEIQAEALARQLEQLLD